MESQHVRNLTRHFASQSSSKEEDGAGEEDWNLRRYFKRLFKRWFFRWRGKKREKLKEEMEERRWVNQSSARRSALDLRAKSEASIREDRAT